MKVLLLDVNAAGSSTGKIVSDLASVLRNTGHEVKVCYGRGDSKDDADTVKIANGIEVLSHVALSRISGYVGHYSPIATRKLIKIIEDFKPDVVHLHELHGYYVNIGAVIEYLKINDIKTIWTFHCEFMYTGRCGHAYDCEKWKTECSSCPQLESYPKSWFFDFSTKMHKEKKKWFEEFENLILVSPSTWLASRVSDSFLSNKRLEVIPNGIDTQVFSPMSCEDLPKKHSVKDEYVVIAVAPDLMSEGKGGKWVVELANRCRDKPVRFIMVGITGNRDKFPENITPLPVIKNQNLLAQYYSMADLTFLPSRRENFPTVVIESLMCGTPVFGFDTGGSAEVAPSGYGIFFDYGDMEKAEETLLKLINHEISVCSSKQCAHFAKKRYSKESMSSAYMTLYEKAIDG